MRVLLLIAPILQVCARVRPDDSAALWALYEAAGGASWVNNMNWDPSKDPCRRFDVPVLDSCATALTC